MITFYTALDKLINIIEIFIVIRIIMSFLNVRLDNFIGQFVLSMTEPILSPARKLIAKLNIDTGMFDFSPIVAILLLRAFYNIIGRILFF